jgi:hypothetical protein
VSTTALLDRLDRPKQMRPGAWMAGCPICQSKRGRPISIRELDDGRTLLHPFCAHTTDEVLSAVGLTMSALFPKPLTGTGPAGGFASSHSRVPARDVLEGISEDVTKVCLIASFMLDKRVIAEAHWEMLAQAAKRIHRARDYLRDR